MAKNKHKHPSEWTIEKLVKYCNKNHIKIPAGSTRQYVIDLVLKDEIDKE